MWTAKRVIILMGGLLATLSAFAIYSLILGGIDGLPPLPVEYYRVVGPPGRPPPPAPHNPVDVKLEMSYGSGCEELRRPYRLWLPEKGIAFAAGQFDIEQKDGRVRLAPFSVAIFHKSKGPGAYPEISTIRSDVAYLTLDRPVSQISELGNRKVIAVELQGKQPGISIGNNRRTVEKSDDVDVLITNGSLFYEERRNLIWTDGVVRLTDHQTKPPTIVRGKGLEMLLAKDTGPNRPREAKVQPATKNNDNGGVERLTLRADVEMYFWVDSRAGFLGGSSEMKPPAATAKSSQNDPPIPADKARIHIRTGGMFVYDLLRETAWFESPPARNSTASKSDGDQLAPDQVHVQRQQTVDGQEKLDQLTCDRLDLQFRRKPDNSAANLVSNGGDKEIETAKATSRMGNDVVVALDHERMAAYGNYLFYRIGDTLNGPQTLLKGEPLRSIKDGHKMVCKELLLIAANKNGEGQSAEAAGPGQIDMLDNRNPDKVVYPTHVLWRDKLVVVKDREGAQSFDLMKVYGEASFMDEVQKQELHGEKIYVWMHNNQDTTKKPQSNGVSRQELHRVLAQDRVRATAPEFIIRQTNRLTMTFIPELPANDRLPSSINSEEKKAEAAPAQEIPPGNPAPKTPKTPMEPIVPKTEEKKPAPPIELQSNEVTVAIACLGTQKQLQELVAKGNVFVFQPGEKKGEKRVDIQGQLLTLKHAEKGDTLTVHGEAKKLARLELGDLIMWGPLVTINQAENRADVEGTGAMEMPSNTNLDGTKPTKGATRITVHWKKTMNFDGKNAEFHGGVMAFENDALSKVLCEDLTAILDRTVSFKEGQKNDQAAKIDRILCDRKVFIDDVKIDERKQLVQRSILQGLTLDMDNLEGPTIMVGPGTVRLLAKGSSDVALKPAPMDNASANAPVSTKQEKLEWKLTRIEFPARMFSNTKANTKNAKFYSNPGSLVEVYNFPTTDIHAVMDADHPPKDGFFLRCEILSVEGRQSANRTTQYMIAERNVFFRTDLYQGYADIVKYDESTEIVIFEGINGNSVRLFQVVNDRPQPMSFNTSKVLYNRKTGEMKSDGVKSITN